MACFQDYSNPTRIVTEACELDAEVELWAKTCPLQYIYQTVTLKKRSEEVFSDYYHTYVSICIATVWNHYRCIRILINELIVDQLTHLRQQNSESDLSHLGVCASENQILTSNATLLQLCHDVCASVPYYLNFNHEDSPGVSPKMAKALHGNFLLWPLYVAGCSNLVSDMMRAWVARKLQWISDVMGIRQAAPLAFTVAQKQQLMSWQGEIEEPSGCPDHITLLQTITSQNVTS